MFLFSLDSLANARLRAVFAVGWPAEPMAREAGMILQVNGLQTIRRFDAGTVTVAMRTILQADQENMRRAKAAAQAKQYTVARLRKPPALDGNAAAWKNVTRSASAGKDGRSGRP